MKPVLKAFFKILLSAAALYYVFTKIDPQQVISIFSKANYGYLSVALLFFIISKIISAWRLNYFFKAADIKLENNSNLRLYLLGMYYNLFLPGGIGGDGYKVYLLNRKFGKKVKDLFWGVMLDRINGVLALFILAMLLVPFLHLEARYSIIAMLLIPISVLAYIIVHKFFFKKFYRIILSTTLLSVGVQMMQLLSALFILYANYAYSDTLSYLFLFLISSIVAVLPITIGGIGSREITFLFGAQVLNLDINLSIALSLLFYIITLLVSFAGIYYNFNNQSLKLKQAEN